jgi:CHAD domain-containing protein
MGKNKRAEIHRILNDALAEIDLPHSRIVALDDDIEAVHQYRVKIRQVRALISFFKPRLNQALAAEINLRLKEMALTFSSVRELDVLTQRWMSIADNQQDDHNEFSERLIHAKLQARVDAYTHFSAKQTKNDLIWITEQIEPWFECDKKLAGFMEKRMNRWLRSIRKDIGKLDIEDYPAMHQLRIRIKRLRYALTLLKEHMDPSLEEKIKPIKVWAEQLGIICDYQRNKEILNEIFIRDTPAKVHLLKSLKNEVDEVVKQLEETKL